MTAKLLPLLLCGALAVTACTRADRFGDGNDIGTGPLSDTLPADEVTTRGLAGAGDPASPAYFQQTIGDRVLFVVDSSTLTPEGRVTLDGQAGWLQRNGDYLAVIEGHADEQGTREYNLALGARRANAVREYLVSRGVAPNRLRTVSYGKERPIEVCSTEACYTKNRRAVTVITAGATG